MQFIYSRWDASVPPLTILDETLSGIRISGLV
jgi:hypothetical protein